MQAEPKEVSADKATTPGQRERFEAAYVAEFNRVLNANETTDHIARFRDGDHYGSGRAYLNGWWKGWQAAEAQQGPRWSHAKPSVPGAYWVRGFRLGEPDSRPALVEVARNDVGTLVCNMHDSNTNDDLREWSLVEDQAERFEWCGPLLANEPAAPNATCTAITEVFERNDERTLISTLLISASHFAVEVTPELIASWSDAECQAVEDYCLAIHYRASDNPSVVIPPRPAVLGGVA